MNSKEKYRSLKVKLKSILYENELFQDELRKLQRELLEIYRDKESLLEKVIQFEDIGVSSSSEPGDESTDNDSVIEESLKEPSSITYPQQIAPSASSEATVNDVKPPPIKQARVVNRKGGAAANNPRATNSNCNAETSKPEPVPKARKRPTPSAKRKKTINNSINEIHPIPISSNQLNYVPMQTTMTSLGNTISGVTCPANNGTITTIPNDTSNMVATTTIHQSHPMIDNFQQQQNVAVIQVPMSHNHDQMNYVHHVIPLKEPSSITYPQQIAPSASSEATVNDVKPPPIKQARVVNRKGGATANNPRATNSNCNAETSKPEPVPKARKRPTPSAKRKETINNSINEIHPIPISSNQLNYVPMQTTMTSLGNTISGVTCPANNGTITTIPNDTSNMVATTTIHQSHPMIDNFQQQQNVAVIQVPMSHNHDQMNYVHHVAQVESPVTSNIMIHPNIQQNHNMIDAFHHHHHHHQQHHPQSLKQHQHTLLQPQGLNLPEQLSPEELEQHLESRRMEQAALLLPDWDAGLSCEILSTGSAIKFMAED